MGRSIGDAAPHRFLPGDKGGLYAWEQVHQCDEIILVEGLFDYAVLWQAGFHNITCLLGYAMDLLHFIRWWSSVNHTDAVSANALASILPDYVRFQAGQQPRPAPASINRRVIVVGCALGDAFPDAAWPPASGFSHSYWLRSSHAAVGRSSGSVLVRLPHGA